MNISDISIGDVVVTENMDIMLVVGIEHNRPKNPIVVQKKVGKEYICSPDHILETIGTADVVQFKACKRNKTQNTVDDIVAQCSMPKQLRDMGLEVGISQIRVRHGNKTVVATYGGYKPSRYKYPVSYVTAKGGKYKCSADSVLAKV